MDGDAAHCVFGPGKCDSTEINMFHIPRADCHTSFASLFQFVTSFGTTVVTGKGCHVLAPVKSLPFPLPRILDVVLVYSTDRVAVTARTLVTVAHCCCPVTRCHQATPLATTTANR